MRHGTHTHTHTLGGRGFLIWTYFFSHILWVDTKEASGRAQDGGWLTTFLYTHRAV